jgi:hypothetical protein
MKSTHYERLFLINRCLEQAAEILEHFKQEQFIHPEYADARQRSLKDIRADVSCLLAGLLYRKELDECVLMAGIEAKREASEP